MNIIFLGTAHDSSQILESLINNNKNVVMVITQPTRKGERGKLSVPEVKQVAGSHNIFCYQTENVSSAESIELIKKYKPDLFITASFSQFLKTPFLQLAPTINVHPSLLPKYRGATPIQSAIINGEKETGVSVLKTVLKMDAGDILLQQKTEILPNETSEELANRLWKIGQNLIIEAVNLIESGNASFTPQDENKVTICHTFKKEQAKLDFNKLATTLKNEILGFNPWPVSFCYYNNKILKIYRAEVASADTINLFNKNECGEVVSTKQQIFVLCSNNTVLSLTELQLEGGKKLNVRDFLNGKKLEGRLN